jgi:peptidoglycan/LPS O-acetylase OafA/YrhL
MSLPVSAVRAPSHPTSSARETQRDTTATGSTNGRRDTHRRPALDGLRALAVAAVVVYHFGGGPGSILHGGFLGVDVFFVLSGYLITGLLLAEHSRAGGVDLVAFWARRARRLLPALALMLLAVTAWVWWASPPDAYPRRRADVFWTLGYLANWHSVSVAEDYFAGYATASPLRHTWSLAVEEQFYLVWPLLLLGLIALGRYLRRTRAPLSGPRCLAAGIVAGIAVSAVAMAAAFQPGDPNRAYYGTEGRVQELFAGALLAVLLPRLVTRRDQARRDVPALRPLVAGLGLAGLVALVAAMALMSDSAPPYYRGGALGVSIAAAALIAAVELAPSGRLARTFSVPVAVGLGRISYGVYLWHWPVTVAVQVTPERGEIATQALRTALTLGAALASFLLVERPLLRGRWLGRSPRRVLAVAGVTLVAVAGAALPATALPGGIAAQLATSSDHPCPGERVDLLNACQRPDAVARAGTPHPRLVLLGDSTARALAPGLDAWATQTATSWVQAAWQRCTPTGLTVVPNDLTAPDQPSTVCAQQARTVISQTLQQYQPALVLVSEFWSHHQPLLVDGQLLRPGTPEHTAALREQYLQLVDEVAATGGRVVFVELPPGGDSLGSVLAPDRPAGSARPPVPGNDLVPAWNALLRDVAASRPRDASVISVTDLVCPGGCPALLDGVLVRTDGVHYSTTFSQQLVPILLERALDAASLRPADLS